MLDVLDAVAAKLADILVLGHSAAATSTAMPSVSDRYSYEGHSSAAAAAGGDGGEARMAASEAAACPMGCSDRGSCLNGSCLCQVLYC